MTARSPLRLVIIGDGQSPHILKWVKSLQSKVTVFVLSSRGFSGELESLLTPAHRFSIGQGFAGARSAAQVIYQFPAAMAWLKQVQPNWLAPHYLTSHGTLACLFKSTGLTHVKIAGSAWGSDILVSPRQSVVYRFLLQWILRTCELLTSDSQFMAQEMKKLGAKSPIQVFPFGLEEMPPLPGDKQPWLFFSNRALEPNYNIKLVIECFYAIWSEQNAARLVIANDGSLLPSLQSVVQEMGLTHAVQFVGRLNAASQAQFYSKAQWFMSLPESDSVSVSVLEAMAHGSIPILSDLPANRELVQIGQTGFILSERRFPTAVELMNFSQGKPDIVGTLRDWIVVNGMFEPYVENYVRTLQEIGESALKAPLTLEP